MRPLKKNVLIAQLKGESESSGGIILTTEVVNKNALVVAIGDEVTAVKVGETVIPDWSKSKPTVVEGKQCAILDELDILGVLEDE